VLKKCVLTTVYYIKDSAVLKTTLDNGQPYIDVDANISFLKPHEKLVAVHDLKVGDQLLDHRQYALYEIYLGTIQSIEDVPDEEPK
jgi:hypothetical protein